MRKKTAFIANPILCAALLALATSGRPLIAAGSPASQAPDTTIDYLEPQFLTGTIYEKESKTNRVLFTFRRTGSRSGSTMRVLREYKAPDGSVAAREKVEYNADKLVSFQLEDLQSGASGSAVLRADPKKAGQEKMFFEYTQREGGRIKTQTGSESITKDTLVNDMVAPYLVAHWDSLMKGAAVKFRMVALARTETVGFKLVKEAETTRQGKSVILIKMEPTSFIIAELIDPIFFTVEKEGAHRLLAYTGRTTPQIKKGNKWKDLDAVTVFDWNAP